MHSLTMLSDATYVTSTPYLPKQSPYPTLSVLDDLQ